MRRLALMPLLALAAPAAGRRRMPPQPAMAKVPSIEEVVTGEGFSPTLSQSHIYAPGAVLVPNSRGGHDKVYTDCPGVEPEISIMSQSSIATSLSAGVSARLSAVRGQVAAGVEKRLSFVDPEQRTIPLADLRASESCAEGLANAARFTDLSQAILVYDVLVAQIQNTVCTKADASGSVMVLGEAEAAAYSECVQESDAQVPLGFKSVPLTQVLTVAAPSSSVVPPSLPGQPAAATASVDFGSSGGLGIDAQLVEQACSQDAQARGASARASRLADAERDARSKASAAWRSLAGDLEKCTRLPRAQRGRCLTAAQQWLSQAQAMPVSIPAGVEPFETACGLKQPAFAADSRLVTAAEVSAAQAMLVRLEAPDEAGDPVLSEYRGPDEAGDPVLSEYAEKCRAAILPNWTPAASTVASHPNYVVAVVVDIGADGTLSNPRILKGSGDAAFDRSGLLAVHKTRRFPPPPEKYARAAANGVLINLKASDQQ